MRSSPFLVHHLNKLHKDGHLSDELGVQIADLIVRYGTVDARLKPDDIPIKEPKGWEPDPPPEKLLRIDPSEKVTKSKRRKS